MAVPKRKSSKARRDKRRNNVWKLEAPALARCKQCGEYVRAHRLCGNCGYYNGKQIVKVGEKSRTVVMTELESRGGAILLYFYFMVKEAAIWVYGSRR